MNNKILIVDDTKTWLMFHVRLIEKLYGNIFDITTAESAMEGLNKLKSHRDNPFSLIITDLQMEMDYDPMPAGEWLVNNIKTMKEYSSSNIVIISSMNNIEEIAKRLNVNCISKNMLSSNRLLMKYMLEKLMPFLDKIPDTKGLLNS